MQSLSEKKKVSAKMFWICLAISVVALAGVYGRHEYLCTNFAEIFGYSDFEFGLSPSEETLLQPHVNLTLAALAKNVIEVEGKGNLKFAECHNATPPLTGEGVKVCMKALADLEWSLNFSKRRFNKARRAAEYLGFNTRSLGEERKALFDLKEKEEKEKETKGADEQSSASVLFMLPFC